MDKTVTGHTEVKDMTKPDKDRWKEIKPGVFRSVLAGRIWTLKQADEGTILYQVHKPQTLEKKIVSKKSKSSKHVTKNQEQVSDEDVLRDYFQLNTSLEELYDAWSKCDKHFSRIASGFAGVRTLRIDPTENLFSFICSSNNNISRITGMVNALCTHYGDRLMEVDGEVWYSFPTVASLTGHKVEAHLRELGFGYRAGYISSSADFIMQNGGSDWLESLRDVTYTEAKEELLKLKGVGPKVADCVCLFSLDKTGAIPVDTHVWQISARDYIPKLKNAKSLTSTIYKEIGDTYRQMFGEYAGWAHSVLFSADLRKFQELQGQKKHSLEKPDQAIKKEMDQSTETRKHSKKLMRKLVTVENAVVKKIKTEID